MRKYLIIILSMLIIYACSKEEGNIVEPKTPVISAQNYYPGGIGSKFIYKIEQIDTTSNIIDSISTSVSSFDSTVTYNGVNYIVENSTFPLNGADVPLKLLFRRTDSGIYFTVDTTGFDALIPDSLLGSITINSDPEANIFSYPLFANKTWTAYKLNIGLGAFELSLIDVQAFYMGSKDISVPALGNVQAEEIIYKVDIKIPDPNNLIDYTEVKFDLVGWFVKDIGLVRTESNPYAANTILGSNQFYPDSTIILRQSLISYDIK